jgi:hypothetical protein
MAYLPAVDLELGRMPGFELSYHQKDSKDTKSLFVNGRQDAGPAKRCQPPYACRDNDVS